jgi:hypothetical protein
MQPSRHSTCMKEGTTRMMRAPTRAAYPITVMNMVDKMGLGLYPKEVHMHPLPPSACNHHPQLHDFRLWADLPPIYALGATIEGVLLTQTPKLRMRPSPCIYTNMPPSGVLFFIQTLCCSPTPPCRFTLLPQKSGMVASCTGVVRSKPSDCSTDRVCADISDTSLNLRVSGILSLAIHGAVLPPVLCSQPPLYFKVRPRLKSAQSTDSV